MAATPKILFRGAATPNPGTLIYTVPASTTAIITNIVITNTDSADATYSFALNDIVLANTVTVGGNDSTVLDLKQVLTAGQTLKGWSSASTVNFHVSGVEIA